MTNFPVFFDIEFTDCVQYFEEEFFNPHKDVAYLGDPRFWFVGRDEKANGSYRAKYSELIKPRTLAEMIRDEQEYRKQRMRLIPQNETEKIYYEETLKMSRERERKLVNKLTKRETTADVIEKARQYPIDELINFKHGFARCLWHEEKTGSLHFIKERNTAHCHGACGRSYDSIDAARKLFSLHFRDAVKKLST